MKYVVFAILAVALFLGCAEGVRLYAEVEPNNERFFGMVFLIMPMVLTIALVALHQSMFKQPVLRGATWKK